MTRTPLEPRLRPRKQPRQLRSVETRARILDAAKAVFAEHGYAAGTTNRIAEAASMSVGSLYQYFPNKDAILVELVHAHIAEGMAAVTGALADAGPITRPDQVEPAISAIVTAMVRAHAADRALHRVLFEESPRPPSLLADLRRLEDTAVETMADVLAGAGMGGEDPQLRARVTVVAIESLVHRLMASDAPVDPDAVATETTRLVSGYVAR
jgi:AcrR family transcriptional regulator